MEEPCGIFLNMDLNYFSEEVMGKLWDFWRHINILTTYARI